MPHYSDLICETIMFTEDEAKTKQCRFHGVTEPRKGSGYIPKCIASDCMGWVATQLPIPATYSLVTGNLITQPQPGMGRCGYVRGIG